MDSGSDFIHQLGYIFLILCGLLIALVLGLYAVRHWLRQKWNRIPEDSKIRLIERCAISPHTRLFYIEVEGRRLLLAESTQEVRAVGEVTRFSLTPPPISPKD
jgi:flagellar biogenesis protein FliO